MQIILTHEQADFDALAAQLGASLLYENALPVLSRRLNRNVRAFLNIYGPELPFLETRDLPPGNIDHVILVDTQSLVTIKGMNQKTGIRVVDHHSPRTDLPTQWDFTGERLGACTTLLVEQIRLQGITLENTQATLMLLGIYEDTGSLVYAGTTPRDVQAAAFLLEQGASLRIVSKHLNPPLSIEQRQLYDILLASAESHHINGQHIITVRAKSTELTEEVSSVAHKLRDLLDPDALFLLVSTPEGIRLVARSTTDQVDVSKIAAHFGGGGHERAAAALIHPERYLETAFDALEAAHTELLAFLPEIVKPSITVGQIMSKRPLTISEDTPAKKAHSLMQKYGYEGYPVVRDGKVIGLLTRRAVDRSLAHKLDLPAASLMDAGEIFLSPLDALDKLQRLMSSSGWGQIPVVDPQSGQVTGIVTRTDLLKSLASEQVVPGRLNLAERLEAALPVARLGFLKLVAERAREMRLPVYIVGGFVRDLLLDRPSFDFDIVVEGDAISLARALSQSYGGRVVSHARFGTARWETGPLREKLAELLDGKDLNPSDLPESLDLITARTEFYDYPTALPTVERSGIKLDLHRRDFTINTMALRLDGRHYGNLYDYWAGLNDLRSRQVRVLHSLSFIDDPTRLLRAVRFEQRFGFNIEARTIQLMEEARPLLLKVSGDRLRHELNLILQESNPFAQLQRLQELDLLASIHPGLAWQPEFAARVEPVLHTLPEPAWKLLAMIGNVPTRLAMIYLTWFGQLPTASAIETAQRLRFPFPLQTALAEMDELDHELPGLTALPVSQIVQQLEKYSRLAMYAHHMRIPGTPEKQLLENFIRKWQHIQPLIDGNHLKELGVPPGPTYRFVLGRLRAAWLDGQVSNAEEEAALLNRLLTVEVELDSP